MNIEFRMDGPLWRFFELVAELFFANLLFILCSIPIVTMGASITALDSVFFKRREKKLDSVKDEFFDAFKSNFKQSTCIWLLYLVFVVMVILNINVNVNLGNNGPLILIVMGVFLALLTMTVLYALAMTARFENNFVDTIMKAFVFGCLNLPYTATILLMIVAAVGLTIQSYVSLLVGFSVWVTVGFALIGYISTILYLRAFRRFTRVEDLPEDSADEIAYRAREEDKRYRAYRKEQRAQKRLGKKAE